MFSENLRKLRNENNLTQEKLAKILKISRTAVGMWETGKREPDITILIAIAEYFGVSIDSLLRKAPSEKFDAPNENFKVTLDELIPYTEYFKTDKSQISEGKIIPNLSIGKNLRELRQKADLSQEAAAEHLQSLGLSVSQGILSRIENDKHDIKISVLIALKQLYSTSFDEIFSGLSLETLDL